MKNGELEIFSMESGRIFLVSFLLSIVRLMNFTLSIFGIYLLVVFLNVSHIAGTVILIITGLILTYLFIRSIIRDSLNSLKRHRTMRHELSSEYEEKIYEKAKKIFPKVHIDEIVSPVEDIASCFTINGKNVLVIGLPYYMYDGAITHELGHLYYRHPKHKGIARVLGIASIYFLVPVLYYLNVNELIAYIIFLLSHVLVMFVISVYEFYMEIKADLFEINHCGLECFEQVLVKEYGKDIVDLIKSGRRPKITKLMLLRAIIHSILLGHISPSMRLILYLLNLEKQNLKETRPENIGVKC